MSIGAGELIEYAAKTLGQSSCEAGYRNCVGRAYYAALHKSRGLLSSWGGGKSQPQSKLRSHAKLINRLMNPVAKELSIREKSIQLGLDLHALRAARTLADYDLHKQVTMLDAEDAVEYAKDIFER